MPTTSEKVIAEYFSAVRAKDVERLMEAFSDDAQLHDPVGTPAHMGREQIRTFFTQTFASFREVRLTEESVYACGNSVAVSWVGRATGPTGASCEFAGIDTFEITENGKVSALRAFWNTVSVMGLLRL